MLSKYSLIGFLAAAGVRGPTGALGSPPSSRGCCELQQLRTAPRPGAAPLVPAVPSRDPADPLPPGARPPARAWILSLSQIRSSWLIVLQAEEGKVPSLGAITFPKQENQDATQDGCREQQYKDGEMLTTKA